MRSHCLHTQGEELVSQSTVVDSTRESDSEESAPEQDDDDDSEVVSKYYSGSHCTKATSMTNNYLR